MSRYGMYVKFITHDKKREELTHSLLQVAEIMNTVAGCELYVINQSANNENAVWVTEIWSSKKAHEASLSMEERIYNSRFTTYQACGKNRTPAIGRTWNLISSPDFRQ